MTETFGTICFTLAIAHTFSVKRLQHLAHSYPEGSVGENLFHLLGEVEVVFGVWALIYVLFVAAVSGPNDAVHYLDSLDFTEPAFVFVIMAVCSTRPVLSAAGAMIEFSSRLLPLKRSLAFYVTTMIMGPLLGSLITEPAAMTVTALIMLERYFTWGISQRLKYATLGLLFVSISIGGTLTPYAAPPVLMVAGKWQWGLDFMLSNFGWKAALAILISTAFVAFRFRKELSNLAWEEGALTRDEKALPIWVTASHLVFLALIVMTSHYSVVFTGIFLFFMGLVTVTREYQREVKLREGLMVAFFLGGLVVLGGPQRWWLEPVLTRLDALALFLGATGLTAITDNAALTYLGSQVPTLTEASRYALVAGAVTGGGLTVIANAPNPAGYGILNDSFGNEGISPAGLFMGAVPPTLIAALCFWLL